ncbi:hypothetical protein [Campylobacter showae]|jgi:hypothetical protein|nr:hypothetical protein [Campylobacter showae]
MRKFKGTKIINLRGLRMRFGINLILAGGFVSAKFGDSEIKFI